MSAKTILHLYFIAAALTLSVTTSFAASTNSTGVHKLNDIIIYKDDKFFSTFPSVVRRPDGELLVAFRRAPERRLFGARSYSHTDPNSQLMLVRSHDDGKTWSTAPELIYADPYGGLQDPCMVQLRDHSILCTTFGWAMMYTRTNATRTNWANSFSILGGRLLRSKDDGHTWQGPIIPPSVPGSTGLDIFSNALPAFNRGAMCEGTDGRLYWAVVANTSGKGGHTGTHLLISSDKGDTWQYSCPVAKDDRVTFNETSLYETPKGDLVAFIRTAGFDDHTVIVRSKDHGKTFQPWEDAGFQGHPHYALRLPDKRVLLVYGYRHIPYGIRARVLNSECTDAATAPEIVLRDDGGSIDLGYPWAVMLSKHRALVVYYFNQADGTRHICGTFLEVE